MSLSGSSSLSSLSPPPDSDDDKAHFSLRVDGAGEASAQRSPSLSSAPSSPKSVSNMKRSASPAHEEVLADNDDIAVRIWRVNRVAVHANVIGTRFALSRE